MNDVGTDGSSGVPTFLGGFVGDIHGFSLQRLNGRLLPRGLWDVRWFTPFLLATTRYLRFPFLRNDGVVFTNHACLWCHPTTFGALPHIVLF